MGRRTIVWPPRVVGGRLEMTPDPDRDEVDEGDRGQALRQVIALSCLDATSSNAWNTRSRLGVRESAFGPLTTAVEARIRANVKLQFQRLERERRARLVGIEFTRESSTLLAAITYDDLETGRRESMEASLNG